MSKLSVEMASLVAFLLVVSGTIGICGPADANLKKREAMAKHRGFFKEAYEKYQSPDERIYVLLPRLANGTLLSAREWESVLITLVQDSTWGKFPDSGPRSGILQHGQVIDVLVAALRDSTGAGKRYAVRTLTWQVSGKMRGRHSGEIQQALGYGPHLRKVDWLLALFAKCGLTPEQKTEVLSWERVPGMVRALCGDEEAETALISGFEKSEDYREKRRLAQQLAYVGTKRCAGALVDGLRSPVFLDGEAHQISIRPAILRALGMIYEDEKLFTTKAYTLSRSYDHFFDRRYGLGKYVDAVDRWVQGEFGRSAWDGEDVWFRRIKRR